MIIIIIIIIIIITIIIIKIIITIIIIIISFLLLKYLYVRLLYSILCLCDFSAIKQGVKEDLICGTKYPFSPKRCLPPGSRAVVLVC